METKTNATPSTTHSAMPTSNAVSPSVTTMHDAFHDAMPPTTNVNDDNHNNNNNNNISAVSPSNGWYTGTIQRPTKTLTLEQALKKLMRHDEKEREREKKLMAVSPSPSSTSSSYMSSPTTTYQHISGGRGSTKHRSPLLSNSNNGANADDAAGTGLATSSFGLAFM
eukprot:PhM_4_TR11306/c0_g1_i2/m.46953